MLRKVFGKLQLDASIGKKFYKVFISMDKDKSGSIDIDEFFTKFHIDYSDFSRRVFEVVDVSGDGDLDFGEFFIGLYNYCTYDKGSIARFAFNLFDVDKSGEIEKQEVTLLVKMMFGRNAPDEETQKIIRILDKDKDGKLSLTEFLEIQKKIGTVMKPAVSMQNQLQSRILGAAWWRKQITSRRKILGPTADIAEMYVRILSENQQADAKRRAKKQKSARDSNQGKGTTIAPAVVFSKPQKDSNVVTKLAKGKSLDIREERGKENNKWYRCGKDRWVQMKYIRITSGDGRWRGGKNFAGDLKARKGDSVATKKIKKQKTEKRKSGGSYAVDSNAKEKLDPNWSVHTDKKTGKRYWHNKKTGETSWKNPNK